MVFCHTLHFTMSIKQRICVFCASSRSIHQKYFEATTILGETLAKHNVTVIYGGGAVGLMGTLADTIMANGGEILGVLPDFMNEVEWGHKNITSLTIVKDMHERKKKLIEEVDAVVVLPGGTGTMEELFEVITLKKLGLFLKPIVIINTSNYFDPLIQMLHQMADENFLRPQHLQMFTVINDPKKVIEAIQESPVWHKDAIKIAGL